AEVLVLDVDEGLGEPDRSEVTLEHVIADERRDATKAAWQPGDRAVHLTRERRLLRVGRGEGNALRVERVGRADRHRPCTSRRSVRGLEERFARLPTLVPAPDEVV